MNKTEYKQYLDSYQWIEKSTLAKWRVGERCQLCNSPNQIEAHHRTYQRLGSELPQDITILCHTCHKNFHDNSSLCKSDDHWGMG